jgi:hypothetical protein
MQSILAFMNGKGGVGKSSLARTAAVERARQKNTRVLLADMNKGQWTSAKWGEQRKANSLTPVIEVRAMELEDVQDLIASPAEQPDVLVLDTAGWKDGSSLLVASWATYVVIPCGGNLGDDVVPSLEFAIQLRKGGKVGDVMVPPVEPWRMGVCLNTLRTTTFESDEAAARAAFSASSDPMGRIHVLNGVTRDMKTYADALSVGLALTETTIDSLNREAFAQIREIDDLEYTASMNIERLQKASRKTAHSTSRRR